jgi:hypothetical protein
MWSIQCNVKFWAPTQHLLWDQRKPRKTLIELAGPDANWLLASSQALVPVCAAALLWRNVYNFFLQKSLCANNLDEQHTVYNTWEHNAYLHALSIHIFIFVLAIVWISVIWKKRKGCYTRVSGRRVKFSGGGVPRASASGLSSALAARYQRCRATCRLQKFPEDGDNIFLRNLVSTHPITTEQSVGVMSVYEHR